jgi:hypothetical protein
MTLDRPHRSVETSPSSTGLIASVLRMRNVPSGASRVSYTHSAPPGLTWSIVDIGTDGACWQTAGEEAIHVLYEQDETQCQVTIDGDSMPILPGDSIAIGAKASVRMSPAVLALHISAFHGQQSVAQPPSHGSEQFSGFNRQTIYATGPKIELERWKLTGPQRICIDDRQAQAIVVLFGKVSCIQSGSIETLDAGESIVATSPGAVLIVPDGLAYVAIACSAPTTGKQSVQ